MKSFFNKSFIAGLLTCFLCILAIGCQPPAKHYMLRGKVLEKDVPNHEIAISHEAIPGFMGAMTMSYNVRDPNGFERLQAGDQITADLIAGQGELWLEQIVVTDSSGRASVTPSQPSHYLVAGDKVPDLPLTNQDGRAIELSKFRGQAVLVTFIYTRCPYPDFCPLISNYFQTIHNELSRDPKLDVKTHLISITLDPAYDTPAVLREYGLRYIEGGKSGFAHWDFARSSPEDLKKLAGAFGLEYYEDGRAISHNLMTILIAPDGTVSQIFPGSQWRPKDALEAMKKF